jgi:spore coat polysaccharide biosynthesis protein SpsF
LKSASQRRKLIVALAVRNQGSRLYGKPLQNLDISSGTTILANIVACLKSVDCLDEIVLGIAEGVENAIFIDYAEQESLPFVVGDEIDVLGRLVACGEEVDASDIFRITSESPFPSFEYIQEAWDQHLISGADATFFDDVVDGCGFEIIKLDALKVSHKKGSKRHRSELCTLYLRENEKDFNLQKYKSPPELDRKDLRLTVDNPEDLVVCRAVYKNFASKAPLIPIFKIVEFLDLNSSLISLAQPFTEEGYKSMYIWNKNE